MLTPWFQKNDKKARWIIGVFSVVVFAAVVLLGRFKLHVDLGFNIHIFAAINAMINSVVAVLLVAALLTVKRGNLLLHKRLMMAALILSVIFLVSYVTHRLFAGESRFGDINHDDILSEDEKAAVGSVRYLYYVLLGTHIFLAAVILPFILFTAYRGLTGEYILHKKIGKITWPLWLYVAVTGPVVYYMISPYYH